MRRRSNPVGSRLAFVERQFPADVAAWVVDTVLAVASDGPVEDAIEPWEDQIPELASSAAKIFKGVRRGRLSEAEANFELERLAEGFADLVAGYEAVAAVGPALTAKEVRQKVVAGELRGFEIVADLGEGYTAVLATPDLNAPAFPPGDPDQPPQAMVEWVDAYAPFQQYMGVAMNNCLQFYRVNYVPYGDPKFDVQRRGGKLYAVLNPRSQPVAATLTDPEGTVIETNGRNNKPPRGADGQALERLETLMGWDASAHGVFDVPGIDENLEEAVDWVLDEVHTEGPKRAEYIGRVTTAARQDGFDGARVVTAWLIYMLVGSPYSARRSVESRGYGRKGEVVAAIDQVAAALRSGDPDAREAARWAAVDAAKTAGRRDRTAHRSAALAARSASDACKAFTWNVAGNAAWAWHLADGEDARYVSTRDYADELLKLMEAEARGELEPDVRAPNPRRGNKLKRRLMP